ncbi:MAG: IPT/TIG domain-containing protein [Cyclobacteriaceae bacterium]|nr:IPT/TIG domain-containing protein [Cyclobacteriaceae bacterium]
MKAKNLLIILYVSVMALISSRCANEDGITYSVTDVSSRITGFSNSKTGPGAQLTINGTQLQHAQRIFIGNEVILARNFVSQTESAITFNVPATVGVRTDGTLTDVLVAFPGSERAFAKIEVVPLQAVSSFTPYSAAAGEIITLFGVNFDLVTAVKLGDVTATITSQSATQLKFTMPSGAPTGKITLVGTAGNTTSAENLVSCTATPGGDCLAGVNLNASFELGTGDNFDNWSKFNGGNYMVQTSVASEVFRGSRALKVVRDGSLASGEWRIQLASDLIDTEAGASYTVYMWAKASTAGGSLRVSTNPDAKYTGNQNVTTQWQRLAFTFSPAAGNAIATTSTRVVLDFNGNNTAVTTFFIDDVKLIKN